MTKLTFALIAIAISFSAFAEIPSEIKSLLNRPGSFISIIDGKVKADEQGTNCDLRAEDSSIEITSIAYFTPVAHLDKAKKEIQRDGTVVFTTTYSGRRPGGSVCGDTTPLLSYKQTVEVKGNTLVIREKFRCLLEGSTEIVQGCKIK
jgi:hypothetical protein